VVLRDLVNLEETVKQSGRQAGRHAWIQGCRVAGLQGYRDAGMQGCRETEKCASATLRTEMRFVG
jgi:hypothetical protein